MWAAKHCSILFSSILQQPDRFLPCRRALNGLEHDYKMLLIAGVFQYKKLLRMRFIKNTLYKEEFYQV